MMSESQSISEFIPIVMAHPVVEPNPFLIDHPLTSRIIQEVLALNNWVRLDRGWALVCMKYSLRAKLNIISKTEHYSHAVLAANAQFIDEIR